MIICKPDITLKDYFKNKDHFADFINVVQFQGQPILNSHHLSLVDTDMSTILDGKNVTISYERNRDIMMKSQHGNLYALTAIENQKTIDYHMPLRNLIYDALHYNQQLRDYLKKDKEQRNRFYLEPLHTLTIYYGEFKWSAPKTLIDMMKCPESYNRKINDWNGNIIDIKDIDYTLFKNVDNRDLVKGIQMFYKGIDEFKPNIRVSKDIAILIISIVNNGDFIDIIQEQEGDEVDMCTLIDTVRQEGLQEGESKGMVKGIVSLLIDLLNDKFNYLSQEIVISIENSNTDQLNSLKTHFFELNSQEDILKVLNNSKSV